ncbi:bifunctional 2-polyprenyl-6-hydroxyphenol methylase/3-demethylubiquinol 3-O-methyltransferase UbiG [Synechococcus sp. 1G10]|uniref:class I SAM-dependent methyltransferase n=1 Tax=Synechococcus sp. 1G10 TaxID=2025605 RepID=UPI00117DC84B|nr:methyltransferase domain-containing protein [Synechococcus sp. 1G10]
MHLADSSSTLEYGDIFLERGRQYHSAMARFPRARDREFSQLFSRFPLGEGENIVDVPSGGGYLSDFLAREKGHKSIRVTELEFSPGFSGQSQVVEPYGAWPLRLESADRIISLASSHHIADLDRLLNNFGVYVRPGGLVHIADVSPDGGIASFLDVFVDRHTTTGHRGIYRQFERLEWPDWLDVIRIETRSCPWRFDSSEQLVAFCHGLFGLGKDAWPHLESTLEELVGIRSANGGVELDWELSYMDAMKV